MKTWREAMRTGIVSVCSAHPLVIKVALQMAARLDKPVLTEATCSQVNQNGGYSGHTPYSFGAMVRKTAFEEGTKKWALGADHLGPYPWRHLPAVEAMAHACGAAVDYAYHGFQKLHIDASMPLLGDSDPLPLRTIAERTVRLMAIAEKAMSMGEIARAQLHERPVYVIGAEVPSPGGRGDDSTLRCAISPANYVSDTLEAVRDEWQMRQMGRQPPLIEAIVGEVGVEFGDDWTMQFTNTFKERPFEIKALHQAAYTNGLSLEVHSTDYQTQESLSALVAQGMSILKVGPCLTHAVYRSLCQLDFIMANRGRVEIEDTLGYRMEQAMQQESKHWRTFYSEDHWRRRHTGQLDRVRYYWTNPLVKSRVAQIFHTLKELTSSELREYDPVGWSNIPLPMSAEQLVERAVAAVLLPYFVVAA